jgi:hypothetical protein
VKRELTATDWSDEGRSLEESDGGTSVSIDGTTELRKEEGGRREEKGGKEEGRRREGHIPQDHTTHIPRGHATAVHALGSW